MKVNVKVPSDACELCGAFDPQVSTRLIWEENRIIGRETEMTCARTGICVDIRIAARREEVMKAIRESSEAAGEQTGKRCKKISRRSKVRK